MNDDTVRLSPHATFWFIFIALTFVALMLFSNILLPFAAGMVIAYLFHPLVDRMCRVGIARPVAAFAIIAVFTLMLATIISLFLPPLINQLGNLAANAPQYFDEARAYIMEHYGHYLEPIRKQVDGNAKLGSAEPTDMSRQIAQNIGPWVIGQVKGLLASSLALFNSIALLFITPVVAFFLMRDWNDMIRAIDKFLPRQDAPTIRQLANEIDTTISAYLRGTLIVLIIISTFYMVTLGALGLNYGLLIGLGAGLISFVPYLGSSSGFIVAGGVATAQYWPNYTQILLVLGIFVFGQLIEGNVLTPNIVGNQVRLHPVWLLFALIASGYILGFTGLLIAVPLAAAIGVLVRYAITKYYESEAYGATNKPELKVEA